MILTEEIYLTANNTSQVTSQRMTHFVEIAVNQEHYCLIFPETQ